MPYTRILGFVYAVTISAAVAAESVQRDVDDFTQVRYAVPFNVEFVAAGESFVRLEGDADTIEDIETRVTGKTLKVTRDNSWFDWSAGDVNITIGYIALEQINMAGSGEGYAKSLEGAELELKITGSANLDVDQITADEVKISIAGSGDMTLDKIDADVLDASIVGSGDISVSGRVNELNAAITGSGDLDSKGLRAQEATVSIRGSGDAVVWSQAHLTASITGSGDIRYYGQASVTDHTAGSGDITHLGDTP